MVHATDIASRLRPWSLSLVHHSHGGNFDAIRALESYRQLGSQISMFQVDCEIG